MDWVYSRLGPRGRLIIQWSSKPPGPKDAYAIRQLIPEFKDKPFGEILAEIRSKGEWVFDELTRRQAEELERRVVELGLTAVLEFPPPD